MSNTYRPTIRYDEKFKEYVDELYDKTRLDRNQIMRLALYVLGHSVEGITILEAFAKQKAGEEQDATIPFPEWDLFEDWSLWLGESTQYRVEREDVLMKMKKRIGDPTSKRKHREGEPSAKNKRREEDREDNGKKFIFKETGGIAITLT